MFERSLRMTHEKNEDVKNVNWVKTYQNNQQTTVQPRQAQTIGIFLLFGLPCYARKAWPHAPPANALAHRFAVIRHSKTLLATLAPRVWVLRRSESQEGREWLSQRITKAPTEHSLRVRPTPGQRCENEQQKLFTWIRRKLPRRAADVQGLALTRKPSDCSSSGRAKHNICGQQME